MPWPLKLRETPNNEWPEEKQPGDIFRHRFTLDDGSEQIAWYVVLPQGGLFDIHSKSDSGGWNVQGEPPNVTLTPSILRHEVTGGGRVIVPGWHGYITNGIMTDDLEGRTYP